MGLFGAIGKSITKAGGAMADTSKPLHTHSKKTGDSSQAKYDASRKEEIPPILPPQPDNIAGNLTGNNKIQDVGKNLWEGEAFAEQRALKRQVGASPVPTPGSEFDEYGGMFAQPLAQRGEIKAANKQRRQDRRQRVKDIKAAGGPENYSADGYHVGEYDKKGRNIQYPEKRYSRKNPPPLNQSGRPYVVNKEKTGTSKDTLYLPKDAFVSKGGYADDVEIRQSTKEAIAKKIYNLPKDNDMYHFSHLENDGKAKYKK